MDDFICNLENLSNWKQMMRSSCKQNRLSTLMAVDITILKLRKFNQKFKKSNISLDFKIKTFWAENQLRAFNWILIAVSGLQKVTIQDFGQEEWKIMQDIFYAKDILFLKFQAKRLTNKKKSKKKAWDTEQQQRLYKYVNQAELQRLPWNEIALKMFADSNGTKFREGKHCRQHWLNYLDPTKTRGKWTTEQDIYLIQSVNEGGKKWCQCASQLKRTEHSVKNRYNSLLVKQSRLTPAATKQHRLIRQLLSRLKNTKINLLQEQSSQQAQQHDERQSCSVKSKQQRQEEQQQQYEEDKGRQYNNEQYYNKQVIKTENIIKENNDHQADSIVEQKDKPQDPQHQQKVQQYNTNNVNNVNSNINSNGGANLCSSFDFSNFIREDLQKQKYAEYPIFSPFIYSPSPTNCLSSPMFIIKQPTVYNTFQCMFSMWGNHITMPMQQMQKPQAQKNNQ